MSAVQNAAHGPASPPREASPRGPFSILVGAGVSFIASVIASLFIGTAIEIIGSYTFWKEQGATHARDELMGDMAYLEQFPRSLLAPDTVAFATAMARYAAWPWERFYPAAKSGFDRVRGIDATAGGAKPIKNVLGRLAEEVDKALVIMKYVAMDTAVRLSVVYFALPAFVMACLLGLVDGLVKRDLRKWAGGRESSFVYHHSKRASGWFLTAGFTLYLAWPVGGFNPVYMVLVFATAVAITLSITVSSFKKYL